MAANLCLPNADNLWSHAQFVHGTIAWPLSFIRNGQALVGCHHRLATRLLSSLFYYPLVIRSNVLVVSAKSGSLENRILTLGTVRRLLFIKISGSVLGVMSTGVGKEKRTKLSGWIGDQNRAGAVPIISSDIYPHVPTVPARECIRKILLHTAVRIPTEDRGNLEN